MTFAVRYENFVSAYLNENWITFSAWQVPKTHPGLQAERISETLQAYRLGNEVTLHFKGQTTRFTTKKVHREVIDFLAQYEACVDEARALEKRYPGISNPVLSSKTILSMIESILDD